MTGILKKAMRGAATAGAALSLEQHRANIEAKKMERMRQYQTEDRQVEQEFRTSERKANEAHDLKMLDKGKGGGAVQGDVQLMNYFQEKGIANSPEEAMNMVREMGTDPSKVILDVAKGMQEIDGGSKPFAEYVKMAEGDVKALRERLNPKKEPAPANNTNPKGIISSGMSVDQGGMIDSAMDSALATTPPPTGGTDTVKIQTDDDYNKLSPGTRYVAPDGKVRIKK